MFLVHILNEKPAIRSEITKEMQETATYKHVTLDGVKSQNLQPVSVLI